jgi:hypothetical protein
VPLLFAVEEHVFLAGEGEASRNWIEMIELAPPAVQTGLKTTGYIKEIGLRTRAGGSLTGSWT